MDLPSLQPSQIRHCRRWRRAGARLYRAVHAVSAASQHPAKRPGFQLCRAAPRARGLTANLLNFLTSRFAAPRARGLTGLDVLRTEFPGIASTRARGNRAYGQYVRRHSKLRPRARGMTVLDMTHVRHEAARPTRARADPYRLTR